MLVSGGDSGGDFVAESAAGGKRTKLVTAREMINGIIAIQRLFMPRKSKIYHYPTTATETYKNIGICADAVV